MRVRPRHLLTALLGLCALLMASPAAADFSIASTPTVEKRPAVAYNSTNNEFMAVYLSYETPSGYYTIRAQRFNAAGTKIGSEISPFGVATHDGLGRPDIAYSPNSNTYYVVVAESVGGTRARVLGRPLAADGTPQPLVEFMFGDTSSWHYDDYGAGHSALRVTHNSVLDEFVVTYQQERPLPITGEEYRVLAQRVSGGATVGSEVELYRTDSTAAPWGFGSHSLAHAPITTSPVGGRYLFVAENNVVHLLDKDLNKISVTVSGSKYIPIHTGHETGESAQLDVAYGRVQGKNRFLIVWSDENNCKPPITTCPNLGPVEDQWRGVWGTYIDPTRTLYDEVHGSDNTPFPISLIWTHVPEKYKWKPRVAYNATAEAFYIAWYEFPFYHTEHLENLTHIRGVWIDYFIEDNQINQQLPSPPINKVVSDVTGTCPQTSPPVPNTCPSNEEPDFPDITAGPNDTAMVVWQQQWVPNPSDLDIAGDWFSPTSPSNNTTSSPLIIVDQFVTLEGTLLGATNDGTASCGNSATSRDVWFQYTAQDTGFFFASTCGTNDRWGVDTGMDTVISLHHPDGTQIEGLCNDDDPGGCEGGDAGANRDSAISIPIFAGETILIRVSQYGGSAGNQFLLNVGVEATQAGRIPDGDFYEGMPLMIAKWPEGYIELTWGESCLTTDVNYEVYEGILGHFNTHEPRTCETGGTTSFVFEPWGDNTYYLVVPTDGITEGSHGNLFIGGNHPPREPGPVTCRVPLFGGCP